MKVDTVFISLFNAYPPTSGAASVTYNVAKYSAGTKALLQMGQEEKQEALGDDFVVVTVKGPGDGRWKKLLGMLNLIRRITDKVTQLAPDTVVLEGASWVVYLHLLARHIKKSNSKLRMVYHAHNVEYELRRQKHGGLVVMLTKWAEGRLFRDSDISTVVSDVDRAQIETLYGAHPLLLPNGVDIARFDAVTKAEIESVRAKYGIDAKAILFMGFYYYKPNMEGIDFLVKEVMPAVIRECPDAKLAVIGSEIPYKEPWLITPGVINYEELPAFVKACGIGAAPIFSGSGTRLKILEYMAAGIPVVSTEKGAEGLDAIADQQILFANNNAQFAGKISKLLMHKELSASIGSEGSLFVKHRYAWHGIIKSYQEKVNAT